STSGVSRLGGACAPSASAPEVIFQWTPTVTGMTTFETCGNGTDFDTVLYIRAGTCVDGAPEFCNDDACPNASGAMHGSRITATVLAGETYYVVVDGFGDDMGNF